MLRWTTSSSRFVYKPLIVSVYLNIAQDIREGTLVLATIREITELELLVSLPNNIKGAIKLPDVSDTMMQLVQEEVAKQDSGDESTLPSLNDLYYVGQFVRCIVVRLEDSESRKRVYLSMRESLLNRYSVFGSLKTGMVR